MTSLPLYGRQGKFTYRLLAITLFGQSVILSFFALVARATPSPPATPRRATVCSGSASAWRCSPSSRPG